MKVKRLVSLLLAVLLLVGMVPLNALAALTGGTGVASEDVTNFKLMLSKSFGTTYTHAEGAVNPEADPEDPDFNESDYDVTIGAADAPYIVDAAGDYGLSSVIDNGTVKSTADNANEAGGKAALEKVDRLFKEGVTTSLTGANAVGKGETFYLGIKGEFLPNESNTWKGVFKYQAIVKYDATKFEVVSDSPTVGTGNGANYRAAVITNPIGVGKINSNLGYTGVGASKAMTYPDTAMKYFGSYKLSDSATLQADNTDSNINYLVVMAESKNDMHYLPSESTWDFVIPMRAKSTAQIGTATFEVVASANGTPSEVIGSTQVYDAKSLLSGEAVKKSYNAGNTVGLTHITSNDVTVEIADFSAAPNGTYAAGSVANRKNLPYISAQDAKATANEGAGPNDTLTFPANETVFQVGDEVRVYGDAEGTKLLGTVTINNTNVVDGITDGEAVAGKVLRLLDDTTGKNFLTSQKEVWIGRMGADDKDVEGKSVNFSKMKKVSITAETPIYYTENAAESAVTAVFGADGTTAAKPISVSFGDSVNEVIKNFDTSDTTTYEVTAENGEKIQASLDWSNLKVENATGNATTDKFNKHGSATIIVPFADKTVDEVTYSQPTAFVDIDTLADKTVPVYGMKLYVDVVPNAADYYIVNDPTDGKSLTLLGETAKALKANDIIRIEKVDGADKPDPRINVTVEDKGDATGIKTEYTIDSEDFPAASTEAAATAVKVSVYLGGGDYSTAVEVPVVAKGTHDVVSDVTVVGEGEDGMTYITPDATVESIFNSLVPTPAFKVTGSDQEIPMDLTTVNATWVEVKQKAANAEDTAYAPMAYADFNSEAESENGHDDAKNYKLIYTIAPKTEAGAAEGEGQEQLFYTNTNKRKIIVTTSVVTRLKLGMKNGAQEVEVTANNPIGSREKGQDTTETLENTAHWDTFRVKDQYTDVQVKDTVKVYDGTATPITTGLVYKIETIDENTRWVYIKVEQLGRQPSNNLTFKVMDDHTPDNDEILPTIKIAMGSNLPKETYSFSKVAAFSPNTFTVVNKKADDNAYANNAEFFAAVKNGDIADIPSQATVEYGYYSAVPVGETVTYMIDPTTVGTVTTDMELSSDTDLTNMAADDEAAAVTVTPNLTGLKTSDNVDIDTTDAAEADKTTTINIKLVSQADAEDLAYAGPALTTLAGAVTLTNKAYPTQDNVAISSVGTQEKALNVFFYDTPENAGANKALFTATIPAGESSLADGAIVTLPADANKEFLAKNGGTFYIRAQQAGGLISEKPASGEYTKVTYGVEPFTLYSVELPESAQTIKKNRDDLTAKTDLAAYFNDVAGGPLPKVFTVNAVRYVAGATEAVADEANKQTTTVTPAATPWKIANDDNTSTAITSENASGLLGTTGEKQTNLTATLAETDFAGAKVSFKPNETANLIAADVLYDADNNNAVTAKLYVTDNEADKAFTIPENAAQYIAASNNNSETGDDDTVKFNFSTKGEGDVETPTTPDMAGAWFRFTADGKTYIGQLSTPAPAKKDIDKTTSLIDEAGNTVTFGGFSTSDANVEVKFYETEADAKADTKGSDGIVMNLGAITGAQKITAAGIENAKSLSFATGVIRSADDFINMLKGVTTATVTVEGGDTVANVPLKTIGGSGDNKNDVSWTLQSKEGEGEWANVSDYATEMGTYSATKSYRLTAELDLGEDGTVGETVLENSENKLAEIPITVYDKKAPSTFPVQLVSGNSDLYTYGEPEDGEDVDDLNKHAKAELDARKAEGYTRDSFKDDLIFYYFMDSYDGYTGEKEGSQRVSTYTTASGLKELKDTVAGNTLDSTAFAAWLADEANKDSWSVEELNADGSKISITKYDADGAEAGTTSHIDPRFSEQKAKYVVPFNTYEVLDQKYIIRYTIKYNGTIYAFERNVKLTYQPGDTDFNQSVTQDDGLNINNISGSLGAYNIFMKKGTEDEATIAQIDALNKYVADINRSTSVTQDDGLDVNNISGSLGALMPHIRW